MISSKLRLAALLLSLGAVCYAAPISLKPFASDGCSLFPDRSLIGSSDWCECCELHDVAYWRGGSAQDRLAADQALHNCVKTKTGDQVLAETMYQGVRAGGSPYFPTDYRWGYGWSYGHAYQALTPEENEAADRLLKEYFDGKHERPCQRHEQNLSVPKTAEHASQMPVCNRGTGSSRA